MLLFTRGGNTVNVPRDLNSAVLNHLFNLSKVPLDPNIDAQYNRPTGVAARSSLNTNPQLTMNLVASDWLGVHGICVDVHAAVFVQAGAAARSSRQYQQQFNVTLAIARRKHLWKRH